MSKAWHPILWDDVAHQGKRDSLPACIPPGLALALALPPLPDMGIPPRAHPEDVPPVL